jgi:hypothetical protein
METETLASDEHTYHSTLCLELRGGELVYHMTNVGTTPHDVDYERFV